MAHSTSMAAITGVEAVALRELFERADALIICAGAGMGVDSGLPDFRGRDGLWRAYPGLAAARLDFTQIASPAAFDFQQSLAWGFYGHRLALYRRTEPHAGFALLLRWSEQFMRGAFVFTSNVDGQFHKAGFDPQRIYECHGSIHHLQCTRPCADAIWSAAEFEPSVDAERCLLTNAPPRCPNCDAAARPNILMFGDDRWIDSRSAAQQTRLASWLRDVNRPLVIECGAGTAVPSVRHFSEYLLQQRQAGLIRINPREPQVPSRSAIAIAGSALEALQAIDAQLRGS